MNTSNDPLAAIRDAIAALPDKHAAPLAEALDTFTALVAAAREAKETLLAYDGHVSNPMYAEGWTDQDGYKAYAKLAKELANFPESK